MRRGIKAIARERFPLPVLVEMLNEIRGRTFFNTVGIKDAYQNELNEEATEITTFINDSGLYRYKKFMFGLSCTPETRIVKTLANL